MNRDNKNLPLFKLETEQGQSQIFLLGIKSSFLKKLEASGKLTNFKTNEDEKCISLLIIEFPMTIYFPSYLFLLVFLQLTYNFWPSSFDILLLNVLLLAIIQYHLIFRNMIYSYELLIFLHMYIFLHISVLCLFIHFSFSSQSSYFSFLPSPSPFPSSFHSVSHFLCFSHFIILKL